MMGTLNISHETVLNSTESLGGFPKVISEILGTLDDPDSNLKVLSGYIRHDPVITARVLSCANKASRYSRSGAEVRDIYTATSLIGLARVRQMTLIGSIDNFVGGMLPREMTAAFWRHSVSVGVCAEEIALHVAAPVSAEVALIAGLLHDIGQLWLCWFDPRLASEVRQQAMAQELAIEEIEPAQFGIDHATIGAWLVEHWELPAPICRAIRGHHELDHSGCESLVPVVHVAEVLANALDLARSRESRVRSISATACSALGIVWDERVQSLFGRMDARSRQALSMFSGNASE